MNGSRWSLSVMVPMSFLLIGYAAQLSSMKQMPGLGALSGTVEAPKAFKAAMVHARNVDKDITYLVYTSAGRYQAVNLFPGNYEVTVEKKGFSSDVKKLHIDAGMSARANFAHALFSSSKIGKIDPKTGKATEYDLPMPFGEPYDVWPDPEDNLWIGDGMNGGVIIKFDPRPGKFTYYPSPQSTDMPKFEITRDGGIWYAARSGRKAAVRALYPDMTKMKTLAAYY
jgi:hypothetical protein